MQDWSGRNAQRQTLAGFWQQSTPLEALWSSSLRPGAALSSSEKFLKAARYSEERRKVSGRKDCCLYPPPPRHPHPLPSTLLLLPLLAPNTTTPNPHPSRPSTASQSLQRGNSLWLRLESLLLLANCSEEQDYQGAAFKHCSQDLSDLAGRGAGYQDPFNTSPPPLAYLSPASFLNQRLKDD